MEQIPPAPEVHANPDTKKADFISPKQDNVTKSVLIMVGVALLIAVLAYGGLTLQQNLEINQTNREKQQQDKQRAQQAEKEENSQLDATRRSNFQEIKIALEAYRKDSNVYPADLSKLIPSYLARVPFDPKTKKDYKYKTGVDQKSFELTTILSTGKELKVENN